MNYPSLWSPEVESRIRAEARNIDPQVTPDHVRRCVRCVQTNQRPRIVFDAEGICSACRYAERKRNGIDWAEREQKLRALLDRHRRSAAYDVVVPVSGGKDSSTVAHRLKHDYGMHPLCVKWAPFMETEIGRRNLENFIHSGFDVVECRPDGLLHRRLARLAFEYLGDPFQPFVYGQLAFPMQVAHKHGIALVFFGENGEAEYSGDLSAADKPCFDTADWDRVYLKGTGLQRLLEIGCETGAFSNDDLCRLSEFYRLPTYGERLDMEDISRHGMSPGRLVRRPEFHWFGHYTKWHPQENYYYAAEHCGFDANPVRSEGTYSKYASLDDKLDGLHYFMAYVKFGIGRCTSDAAHEIRDGEITREEGLALVKRFDGEFPERHLDECLDYLGMDRAQLDRVIERFRGKPQLRDAA